MQTEAATKFYMKQANKFVDVILDVLQPIYFDTFKDDFDVFMVDLWVKPRNKNSYPILGTQVLGKKHNLEKLKNTDWKNLSYEEQKQWYKKMDLQTLLKALRYRPDSLELFCSKNSLVEEKMQDVLNQMINWRNYGVGHMTVYHYEKMDESFFKRNILEPVWQLHDMLNRRNSQQCALLKKSLDEAEIRMDYPEVNITELIEETSCNEEDIRNALSVASKYVDKEGYIKGENKELLVKLIDAINDGAPKEDNDNQNGEKQMTNSVEKKKRTKLNDNDKEKFFSDENIKEKRRLFNQQKLLLDYDMQVYKKMLRGKSDLNVLDLGTGNGSALMNRLGNRKEVAKIIGIEYDETNVRNANENYGTENVRFYQADVEADSFPEKLEQIMEENNIESFDFINVLALIAHLKNPSQLFKVIRKYCSPGAQLFIRNIDDGFNIVFPDQDGNVSKALSLLQYCTSSGYRFSGREIFTILKLRGYKKIKMEKQGINTIGMDIEERETFHNIVFGFVKASLENEIRINPESKELKEMYEWYLSVEHSVEVRFLLEEFFFNCGFLIYTAKV